MPDPAPGRRSQTSGRYRRRRALVVGGAVVLAGAGVAVGLSRLGGDNGGGNASSPSSAGSASASASTRLKLVAKQAPHPLPAPISGESITATAGAVYVMGGLDAASNSASGIFRLDPHTARVQPAGNLTGPVHDAASAALGSRVLLFGGGTATSTDAVQAFTPGQDARAVGRLPAVRSDLAAVTLGNRAYVLGGYDGQTLSADVLATSDGSRFSTVARLPVPVRYPAVSASGHTIYVFGGETAAGKPTDAIQAVDVAAGSAHLVGHLPDAVDHASAVTLGGHTYVLGGSVGGSATDRILAFDPAAGSTKPAGSLPMPVTNAAAAVDSSTGYLVGGIGSSGGPLASVITLRLVPVPVKTPATTTGSTTTKPATTTTTPAASSTVRPFAGKLMIADRGNDRILIVDAKKHILWRYPAPGRPPPAGGFNFPDDAFFIKNGTGIITNQEENETIVELGYPSGKVVWSYGHPGITGSTAGYLHEPDDAYLLRDGTITVADAQNCRILFIKSSDHSTSQLGNGTCVHDPPRSFGSPNGDTPLANGDILVSEVNGSWIDEITRSGHVVWSTKLPIAYPSDPQQIGPDRYLAADYTRPGGLVEFDRTGKILWTYRPTSGNGMLDHPSLAVVLPNGLIAVNDDYRHRVVLIDPKTKKIVWQYGRTDQPGTAPGLLNTPDGLDYLDPTGVAATHPYTG